ncbi:MAG: MFS transporter [Acholeplasmatales bacterium]
METLKYKISQAIRYLGDASFYAFFALYLSLVLGYKEDTIGLILMILPLVGMIFNIIFSLSAKNINYNRTFMIIMTVIEGILLIILLQVTNLPIIIFIVFLLAIVGQPFYSLYDGYTALYSVQSETNYSSIRLYGSLGYAVGALVSGYVTKNLGYHYAFYSAAGLFIILALVLYLIKPLELKEELKLKPNTKELLKNKKYIKFAIFYVISLSSLFLGGAFLGTYFDFKGLGSDILGMVTFAGVIMEIIVLIVYAKWGKKFSMTWIMLSIVATNFIIFFTYSFNVSKYVIISIALIRSIGMGGLLYIGVEYIKQNVKSKNTTLAITLYTSLRFLVYSLLVFGSGYFIVDFGYYSFYLMVSLLSLTALFFIDYKPSYDIIKSEEKI